LKILITGTAGRVGRAIYINLMKEHQVVGIDQTPCSTADYVGDIRDDSILNKALDGVDVIIHCAALHAPHIGLMPDSEFEDINVKATKNLALVGIKHGIKHFIFTSTTALYGFASTPKDVAGWVNEKVIPKPKTIYHKTKIKAEQILEKISKDNGLPVTVLQMSRCFPEPADLMAVYRLSRGIDARDVASAHACAVTKRLSGFKRFIISGNTPFHKGDCQKLNINADTLLREYAPSLAKHFDERGWPLPKCLDRVYDSSLAQKSLSWLPKYGYVSVFDMLDNESAEVLPVLKSKAEK